MNGQANGFALNIITGLQIAHDTAGRRHFAAPRARHAAQFGIKALFQSILADLEARRNQQRIVLLLIIPGVGRAHIADKVPDARPGGVET